MPSLYHCSQPAAIDCGGKVLQSDLQWQRFRSGCVRRSLSFAFLFTALVRSAIDLFADRRSFKRADEVIPAI